MAMVAIEHDLQDQTFMKINFCNNPIKVQIKLINHLSHGCHLSNKVNEIKKAIMLEDDTHVQMPK